MSDCIEWEGNLTNGGYGYVRRNGKTEGAHRIAWMDANDAEIPAGMVVMHSCDNRKCINPDHLSLGTQSENIADGYKKGRIKQRRKVTREMADYVLGSDKSYRKLAAELDVAKATIQRIKEGKTWLELA